MERTKCQATSRRQSQYQGNLGSRAKVVGGGVERDLGRGLGGEVGELEFLDRAVAAERESNGIAGASALGQGRVEYARTTEIGEQSVSHFEGAAVGRDVLAHHNAGGAFGKDFAMGGVEGLGVVELLRLCGQRAPGDGFGRGRKNVSGELSGVGLGAGDGQRQLDARFHERADFSLHRFDSSGVSGGD